MTATVTKMNCPDCGAEMNHHCDKVLYASETHEGPEVDPAVGGFIEEFHACPKCGGAASRRA